MATQQVDKVTFHNVLGAYVPGETVLASYKLSENYEVNNRDWIGLFRVGWSSNRDYYTFEWAPAKDEEGLVRSVKFSGSRLPPDDGLFYQFCYVSRSGSIKGASRPFQFSASIRSSTADDLELIEVNEEDSLLLLRSKNETKVSELEKKVTELTQHQVNVEESFVKIKTEKAGLEDEIEALKAENETIKNEIVVVKQELESKNELIAVKDKELTDKDQIIFNQNKIIEDYKQKLSSFEDAFQDKVGEIEQVQKSKDALKHELDDVTSHLQQIQVFSDRKEDELIAAQNMIKQLKEENQTVQAEKTESETHLRIHCSQLEESQRKLEEEKESLLGRSEYYQAEAERNQQTIEVMKVQISSLENDMNELAKELDKEKTENQAIVAKLASKEQEVNVMQQNVCEMAGNIKEPRDSLPLVTDTDKVDKSIFDAVQMACEDLGERLKAEQKVNQTQKRKVQELEKRVALCHEEYERMATENVTLQKKLKKSGSNTPTNAYPNEKAKLEHELEQFQLMHDRKIAEKNEILEHQAEEMKTLEEEARKLQDQLAGLTHQETAMKKSIQTLNVENEQLKRELRELKQQQASQLPKYTPSDVPPPPYGQGQSRLVHPPPPQRSPHGGYAPPTQHRAPPQTQQLHRDGGSENTRTCPMCGLAFPARTSQATFEQHVNSHFRN